VKNRKFREIVQADIGRSVFQAFGCAWLTTDFIGRIARADVGKRVYLDRGVLSVENDAQFRSRLDARAFGSDLAVEDGLTKEQAAAMRAFVRATEALMLGLSAEEVGRIADYVGEHGTDGDGGALEDGAVVECLRVIVDAMGRK
jgi:hypothetical protein